MEETVHRESQIGHPDTLKAIGLTEYESKAYITLLKYGTLTAEKISELGKIPLPRVYDTISELQKKGFVLVGHSRPKRFKPLPPEKAITLFMEYQKKQLEHDLSGIKDRAQEAIKALKSVESTTIQHEGFNVWSVERRSNVIGVLVDCERKAKKEILCFAGDMSWIKDVSQVLKDAVKRGVIVKIVVHDPKGNQTIAENVKLAKKVGCIVKTGFKGVLRGQLIDGNSAYVATKLTERGVNPVDIAEPGMEENSKYEMMIIDNPSIVGALREYFFQLWKDL